MKTGPGAERARSIVPEIGVEDPPPHESHTNHTVGGTADGPGVRVKMVDPEPARAGKWGPVTTTILKIGDRLTMYERLRNELTLGDGATQYGEILASADRAELNMLDASRLHRAARLEEEDTRHEAAKEEEVLRSAARTELEKEKAAGERTGKPTIQDLTDRMVANWPDQMDLLRRRKDEIHGVVAVTETLETAWRSRASTLREMLARYAPTRMS